MSTILSQTTYAYDKAHNRVRKVKDGVQTDYAYNNLNQLTGFTEGLRQVAFSYDANGNRATRTEGGVVDSYGYDYENRLVSLQKGGVPYTYAYDYRTRRVERVEGSTATKIVFSGGTSVQEYEGTNKTVEYIRGSDYGGGIGGILYTLRNSVPSYTHYNNRGDVVAKTDADQALTYQAEYEAFGTRTKEVGQTQDRQKANTKDEDPTGLLNEGFRYRDLETGSFITRDPLGFKDGPNLYTYVHQNPWTKFDPQGLWTLKTTLGVVASAAAVGVAIAFFPVTATGAVAITAAIGLGAAFATFGSAIGNATYGDNLRAQGFPGGSWPSAYAAPFTLAAEAAGASPATVEKVTTAANFATSGPQALASLKDKNAVKSVVEFSGYALDLLDVLPQGQPSNRGGNLDATTSVSNAETSPSASKPEESARDTQSAGQWSATISAGIAGKTSSGSSPWLFPEHPSEEFIRARQNIQRTLDSMKPSPPPSPPPPPPKVTPPPPPEIIKASPPPPSDDED